MSIKEVCSKMYREKLTALLFLTSLFCAMVFGFFLHGLYNQWIIQTPPIQFIPDMQKGIATLSLLGQFDNQLIVQTGQENIRLLSEEDIFLLKKDTTYQLTPPVLSEEVMEEFSGNAEEKTPTCTYVASKKGKTAYLKSSAQGKKLQEPRCFKDQESAKKAGLKIYSTTDT